MFLFSERKFLIVAILDHTGILCGFLSRVSSQFVVESHSFLQNHNNSPELCLFVVGV